MHGIAESDALDGTGLYAILAFLSAIGLNNFSQLAKYKFRLIWQMTQHCSCN